MELVPGQAIGPYRLVEQAGSGGMAVVWRAYHARLERYVAIKFLSPLYATDAGYLERFQREARAVSRLEHPNILTVYDFGEQDGWTYMVSPFIGGGTLADRLRRGAWTEGEAAEVLGPLAYALDYAHGEGIVHRDIKPSNVLFTERGRLVLSDFGIARIVEASTVISHAGLIVGTPMYMSPEQADGLPAGPTSDLYSLGVVAYEMLTGRPPFMGETPLALLRAHIDKPLPPPRTLNPRLPESVEAALFRALSKDPADRFPCGVDFVLAILASGTLAAPAPSPAVIATVRSPVPASGAAHAAAASTPTGASASAHLSRRAALGALAGLVVAGLGLGGAAFVLREQWRSRDAPPSGPVVVEGTSTPAPANLTRAPADPATTGPVATEPAGRGGSAGVPPGSPSAAAASPATERPSGQWLVVLWSDSAANDLHILEADGTVRRLTGPAARKQWSWAPAISPDGRKIAFNFGVPGRADIVVTGLDGGGRYIAAASTDGAQWGSPSWRADGVLTFHGVQDGRDGIFQTSGVGPPSLITTGGGVAEPPLPTWPRMHGPLAFAGKDGAQWHVWTLANDGSARRISPAGVDSYAPAWTPDGSRIAFQGGGAGIVTVTPDGADHRVLVPAEAGVWTRAPAWSPDGRWIAYVSGRDGAGISADHGDLWVVPASGGASTRVTNTGAIYDWRPIWVR